MVWCIYIYVWQLYWNCWTARVIIYLKLSDYTSIVFTSFREWRQPKPVSGWTTSNTKDIKFSLDNSFLPVSLRWDYLNLLTYPVITRHEHPWFLAVGPSISKDTQCYRLGWRVEHICTTGKVLLAYENDHSPKNMKYQGLKMLGIHIVNYICSFSWS